MNKGWGELSGEDCSISKCSFVACGSGNRIVVKGVLHNSKIKIEGQGLCFEIGQNVRLNNMFVFLRGRNGLIRIGEDTSFGGGNLVCDGDGNWIEIGKNSMIAEGTDIWNSDSHKIFKDGLVVNNPRPITIGDNVWIGKDAAVLKGAVIADGAIIGMRSIVTGAIEPRTVNVGSPAKKIQDDVDWKR